VILSYVRTAILYLVLIAVVRVMGKRQVGQMEPSELVVAMLVADLASIPMQNEGLPLFSGVVPILTVLGLELVLSALSVSSIRLRRLLCGKPVILIENGHLLQQNLRKTRITVDELTGLLRLKDVLELNTVQYAILETSGDLSVFLFPEHRPASAGEAKVKTQPQGLPVSIIEDGKLMKQNLPYAKKTTAWVRQVLKKNKSTVQDTFLLTVDEHDRTLWLPMEEQP
jgi:uncharacterized membrane protein YcaP (DUF421 family)